MNTDEITKKYDSEKYPELGLTRKIIKCCFNVHNELGSGFNEVIFQRALAVELRNAGLPFEREVWLNVMYKGSPIGKKRVDFFVEDCIIEIKAKAGFDPQDYMQLLAYLKTTGYKLGLLVNFGGRKVEVRRFVN